MTKKKLFVMASLLIIAIGGVLFYTSSISNDSSSKIIKESVPEKNEEPKPFLEIEEKRTITLEEEWPIGETSETAVQNVIHGMSHQKVEANEKWYYEAMTMEKILHLQNVVEASDFEHKNRYASILERWANNDFSQVVEDHNFIWKLQGGNVGKAVRAYTYEEELEFIKSHYE